MKKNIDTALLKNWRKNFTGKLLAEGETESSIIDLNILKAFIAEAEKKSKAFNAVRIYFIRYGQNDGLNAYSTFIRKAGTSRLSQVSLAFVPVKNFDPETLMGEDIVKRNKIFTLSFCHPQYDYDPKQPAIAKGTGHCPPKCNG